MKYTAELAAKLALLWMDKRPFSKQARARRMANRQARKEGAPMPKLQLNLGTRTTTNMTVSGVITYFLLHAITAWLPGLPLPANAEEWVALLVAYIIGRISKSPAAPKVL